MRREGQALTCSMGVILFALLPPLAAVVSPAAVDG
jgi:hypothetical protein